MRLSWGLEKCAAPAMGEPTSFPKNGAEEKPKSNYNRKRQTYPKTNTVGKMSCF